MLTQPIRPVPPVLDPAALARLAELDPGGRGRLLHRVLETFVGSVARMRPQFDAGRRAGELDQVRLVAHTLKSSSASIGARRLSACCATIESAIRLGHLEELPAAFASFDDLLDEALQAIDLWFGETH